MKFLDFLPVALVHLFPTTIAIVFAINFVHDVSVANFLGYFLAATLGGVVYACQIIASDTWTLISINRATRELGFSELEVESHEDLLSEPALGYFHRFLGRMSLRSPKCSFVRCDGKTMESCVAFSFLRYHSVCIHSLGEIANQPRPKNPILFHELGHMFIHQARSGYLFVLFGSVFPLLWLTYEGGPSRPWAYEFFLAILVTDLLLVPLLDRVGREVNADGFALACWFTEYFNDCPEKKLAELHQQGRFFGDMPPILSSYEVGISSKNFIRRKAFRKCYTRMNEISWLNGKFRELEKAGASNGIYWKELFFRKALPGYYINMRNMIYGIRVVLVMYLCFGILDLEMSVGSGVVLVAFAALSVIWVGILVALCVLKEVVMIEEVTDEEAPMYALFGAYTKPTKYRLMNKTGTNCGVFVK